MLMFHILCLYGVFFTLAPECRTAPCLNEGTCLRDGVGSYRCFCTDEFFGVNCENGNICLKNLLQKIVFDDINMRHI